MSPNADGTFFFGRDGKIRQAIITCMVYVPPICSNIVLAIMKTSFDAVIVPKEVSVCECAILIVAHCTWEKLVNYNLVNRN